MSIKKMVAVSTSAAALIAGSVAFAGGPDTAPVINNNHAYVSVAAGYAHYFDRKDFKLKNTNTYTGRLAGGYMFSKNLGAELGVAAYGSTKRTVDNKVYKYGFPFVVDADVVGRYDFNDDFFGTAKLGLALVDAHQGTPKPVVSNSAHKAVKLLIDRKQKEAVGTAVSGTKDAAPKLVSSSSSATATSKLRLAPTATLAVGYNLNQDMAVMAGYRYIGESFAKGKVGRSPAIGSAFVGLQWTL